MRSREGRKENVNDFLPRPLPFVSRNCIWELGVRKKKAKGDERDGKMGWGRRGIFEFDYNVASLSAQLRTRRMDVQGYTTGFEVKSSKPPDEREPCNFKHRAILA